MTARDAHTPAWIAADWGTSHLRLWLMGADGTILRRMDSDKGMGCLTQEQFEPVLLSALADVLTDTPMTVVCCGMAGSRQGWAEAPYAAAPCVAPGMEHATKVATQDPRLNVFILPGIKQLSPADVMRGEETQIAGVIAHRPGFEGVICLPGTHTKWAKIKNGQVQCFGTFMTGEMFALLSSQSVLRHTVGDSGWDEDAFVMAVTHTMDNPSAIAGNLFSLRAEALVASLSSDEARARLSGLLLGAELSAAREFWREGNVAIVGENTLANAYVSALKSQGKSAEMLSAEDMTLNGLRAAYLEMSEA